MIAGHGGEVTNYIGRKTDYLVAGERAGSKLARAREAGTPVITIHQFLHMIQPRESERSGTASACQPKI